MVKVVRGYKGSIRCCICLEDYVDECPSTASTSAAQKTQPQQQPTALLTADRCAHHVCQPCLEQYTISALEQSNANGINNMTMIECPFPECDAEYLVEDIITQVLPFRHRLVFWWRQMIIKNNPMIPAKKRKKLNPPLEAMQSSSQTMRPAKNGAGLKISPSWQASLSSSPAASSLSLSTTATETTASSSSSFFTWNKTKKEDNSGTQQKDHHREMQRQSSVELLRLALEKNWTRCPHCRYFIERSSGCNHIVCRCGSRL
ncbi:hypothetical protein BDB00DRAFT_94390 [Zychaea mexicana]|uniref:uncharacterized protein n=1 Tax=Zychaea mexicana TaxID=64656 RepID=UPI0022FF3853|nr:uncharacterized protein BDB00DRAFT_94390 [Zychaea mexicana]KAI9485035.1 hypothetical protein BDB00DRAFT_94390 [Zychaea mexicana]